jgi:hypothetical protein
MAKGRFLNQKLGKRISRKYDLLRSRLSAQRPARDASSARLPKKGASRETGPGPRA